MTVHITIPGNPVPKARPRVTKRGVYTPRRTKNWEEEAKWHAISAMGGSKPLEGALIMTVYAYFDIPSSWPQWKKRLAEDESVWHTVKPDVDNIEKAVADSLSGIVYRDDAQICFMSVCKRYSPNPRTVVHIKCLGAWHSHSKQQRKN